MKRTTLLLTVASFALVASSGAVSGEIYTWIDDDGGIHYEDRPTEEQVVQRVGIDSRATDNEAVYAQTQARLEAKAVADQVAAEAPATMSRKEVRAEKEKRQQQCQSFRNKKDEFLRARALYNEDENGERVYQDESQRQATMNRIEDQIREYCGA
jgi:hypothetical protein